MAPLSDTEQVNEILERMSVADLDKIIRRATTLRPTRIFRFMDLPPELRNRIYRFAIRPHDIEKHANEGKAPALLKVNHQVSAEFRGLYYSHEFMTVEYYDHGTKSWIKEKNADYFRLTLARRGWCGVEHEAMHLPLREFIIRCCGTFESSNLGKSYNGVFSWKGSKPGAEVQCRYYEKAFDGEMLQNKIARSKVSRHRRR